MSKTFRSSSTNDFHTANQHYNKTMRSLLSALLIAPALAFSQSSGDTTSKLGEVIVTASRHQEYTTKVPSSVTVVSQKEIQQQIAINPNITSVLAQTVPGLGADNPARTVHEGQLLRGRRILVLVDGIPQSTPMRYTGVDLRTVDPFILNRVEVLKGATAIYGNGADGGIINYVTQMPTTDKPLSVGVSTSIITQPFNRMEEAFGYRNSTKISGRVNKFAFLIAGTYEQNGKIFSADAKALAPVLSPTQQSSYGVLGKVSYDINEKQRLILGYSLFGFQNHSSDDILLGDRSVSPYPVASTAISPSVTMAPGELTPAIFRSNVGKKTGVPANHNAYLTYQNDRIFEATSLHVNVYLQRFHNRQRYYTLFFQHGGQPEILSAKQGLRANFSSNLVTQTRVHWRVVYGVDILNDKTTNRLVDGRLRTPIMNMVNLAPYAQTKISMGTGARKPLIIDGGIRFERLHISYPDYRIVQFVTADGKPRPGRGGVDMPGGTLNYHATVVNVGLRYNPIAALNTYLSFSQSFAIPEVGRDLAFSRTTKVHKTISAVVTNNYEVGFVGKINPYFQYEAVGFISTSEFGLTQKLVDGLYQLVRAPEFIYGSEWSVKTDPLSWLQAGGTLSYVEGFSYTNKLSDVEQRKWLNHSRISAPKATAFAQLRLLKDRLHIFTNVLWNFKRDRFKPDEKGIFATAEGPSPFFNVVNMSVSYRFPSEGIQLSLAVTNLLNNDYYATSSFWYYESTDRPEYDLYLNKAPGMGFRLSFIYQR